MSIVDLTTYNNQELSCLVFNSEPLYNKIKDIGGLITELDKLYKYTDIQKQILILDIKEYLSGANCCGMRDNLDYADSGDGVSYEVYCCIICEACYSVPIEIKRDFKNKKKI